mmetsp:Transcript_79200/g.181308  ORF Transcript_79200/g.181308 Transcript_79200/m.181308 type:complete len:280 (-) Transcript_79200:87-926(-)
MGSGSFGQLGLGAQQSAAEPTVIRGGFAGNRVVLQIAAGGNHSMAVVYEGVTYGYGTRLYAWGHNAAGQLGTSDTVDQFTPRADNKVWHRPLVSVCCGDSHTALLTRGGELYTWGHGGHGRLGHGSEGDVWIPRRVRGPRECNALLDAGKDVFVEVACGSTFTVAVTRDQARLSQVWISGLTSGMRLPAYNFVRVNSCVLRGRRVVVASDWAAALGATQPFIVLAPASDRLPPLGAEIFAELKSQQQPMDELALARNGAFLYRDGEIQAAWGSFALEHS